MEITRALVHRLVTTQFPHWADHPVHPVATQGMDNATYHLGDDKLVRLPRHARWENQVAREQYWLPRLAPHLPLAIPEPLAHGEPGQGYPFAWSVYRWLPGETADNLTDLHQAAEDLAGFLKALQAIPTDDGPPPEWSNGFRGVDIDSGLDSAIVATRLKARIAESADPVGATEVWQAALAAPRCTTPVWIHGDPYPTNLLATDGRLSAVIDFGTSAVGDPATDLIAAWSLLDQDSRHTFRAALDIDDATWARGKVWGLSAVLDDPIKLRELLTDPR